MNAIKRIAKSLLKVLYVFPVNEKKVYLINFNGTSYGFDAKAFAEYLQSKYPGQYIYIWESKDRNKLKEVNKNIHFINKSSFLSVFHEMTAGIILGNFVPRAGLPYRKEQIIINTWHGNPIKKVGRYAMHYNSEAYQTATCFLSHSERYTNDIVRDSFEYYGEVLNCGVPRNDLFFMDTADHNKNRIKRFLGIGNCKIALYAPTFRGDFSPEEDVIDYKLLHEALVKRFGGDWIILYRLHPMVAKSNNSKSVGYLKDASDYPDMQELLLISDVLLTDYSSSMWDYSLQRKPVFLFAPDAEKYEGDRGLYYPLSELPYPVCLTNEQLYISVTSFDNEKYADQLEKYFNDCVCYENGNSCEEIMRYIHQHRKTN